MNYKVFFIRCFSIPVLFLFSNAPRAQISVVSTAGYQVNIYVVPKSVIPSTTNCPWGYNYNLALQYQVTFTGTNIPSSLYTLQGTVTCGSNSNFYDLPNNGGTGTINTTSNQWSSNTDCKTVTPSSLNCNVMNIEISGLGINAQTISYPINQTIAETPLPINLTGFTAAQEGKIVKLKWETASENDNDYFTIQRSANQNEWIDIEKVKGADNSSLTRNYIYNDNSPLRGISYYRIKQTDLDGKFTFSSVIVIQAKATTGNIAVFPNPNRSNNINLRDIKANTKYSLLLTDINGRIFYKNDNISSGSVMLPSLKSGMYFIKLTDKLSGERKVLRYVKL